MKFYRYIAMLVLMAFVFTTVAPVGAWAADPVVPTIPKVTIVTSLSPLVAGALPTTMDFTVSDFPVDPITGALPTNTKVSITFPKEVAPQKDFMVPAVYTVSGQTVNIAKTTNDQKITVNVKIADTTMASKNVDFNITIGGTPQVTPQVPMHVSPSIIDLKGSADLTKPRSNVAITKATYNPAEPAYYKGNGTINLYDAYGNLTTGLLGTETLYLWVINTAGGTAEIADTTGFSIEKITSSANTDYYRVTGVTSSTLSFSVKSLAAGLNQAYTLKLAKGTPGTTVDGLNNLPNPLMAKVDFSKSTLTMTGIANTHASVAKPSALKISLITDFDRTGKVVEVQLPAGFKTDQDNANKRITMTATSQDVKIIEVPNNEVKNYTNAHGFQLYVDGVLYHPTEYNCSIDVQPAPLTVKVDNSLDFRHGTTDARATTLELSVSGIDAKIATALTVTLPAKTVAGLASPIAPDQSKFPAGVSMVIVNGDYRVTFATADLTQKIVKLSLPITVNAALATGSDYDQTIPLIVESSQTSGKLFEQIKSNLRYKITDSVINSGATGSTIDKPTDQVATVVDGKTLYSTTTTLNLKDSKGNLCQELNGRNLYVWITTPSGGKVDEFDIIYQGDKGIRIKNPELGELEGSSIGQRNVFKIMNTTMDPEKLLGDDTIEIKISTKISGDFKIKMATGRSATEAFGAADGKFVFYDFKVVGNKEFPVVTVKNKDKFIYHNSNPPGGNVSYTVDNLVLKDDPLDPKKNQLGRIHLPAGFEVDGKNYIEFSTANKVGRSYTGTALLTKVPTAAEGMPAIIYPVEYKDDFELGIVRFKDADEEGKPPVEIDPETKPDPTDLNCMIKVSEKKIMPITLAVLLNNGQSVVKATPSPLVITATSTAATEGLLKNKDLWVWVTEKDKAEKIVTTGVMLTKGGIAITPSTETATKGKYLIPGTVTKDPIALQLTMAELGKYDLYTSLVEKVATPPVTPPVEPIVPEEPTSFEVVETPAVVDTWSFQMEVDGEALLASTGVYNLEEKLFNKTVTIKATLVDKDKKVLPNKEVLIAGTGLTFSPVKATTDANGVVTFATTTPNQAGTYSFKLTHQEGTEIKAKAELQMSVKEQITPPPTTDEYYDLEVVKMVDVVAVDSRAFVYLEVFDKNGHIVKVTSDTMAKNIIQSVKLRYRPDNSDLSSSDAYITNKGDGIEISFTPDYRGTYELVITGNGPNGEVLVLDFVAKDQGKVVDMKLTYDEDYLGLGQTSSRATLLTYDAEGIAAEIEVTRDSTSSTKRAQIIYTGSAVESMDSYGAITVRDRDYYIGSTITVQAIYNRGSNETGLTAEYNFEVREYSSNNGNNNNNNNDNDNTIKKAKDIMIWDTIGGMSQQNRFDFYLVDESGFKTQLKSGQLSTANGAEATVSVASKPYNAKVTASIPNNARSLEQGDSAYLDLYCDKEGTVKLDITLKIYNPTDSTNSWKRYDYFRKRVEIQIAKGTAAVRPEDTQTKPGSNANTVAMFIGSKQYTVNGGSRVLDEAPFVQNNRTMVPIRALGDSLGAATNYDAETKKITINYSGNQITMAIGSSTIDTNYGPIYSDVPPMALDGRTFIPLRAAAEALGCQITTVTNIEGKVIGAIFTK